MASAEAEALASLYLKYGEPCKTVVENPDSRVEYWMKKAATDLAR